jgi:hypothetical protein
MESDPTWGKSIYRTENQIAADSANRKVLILRAVCFALFLYSFVNILTLTHPATVFDIFMGILGFVGLLMLITTLVT